LANLRQILAQEPEPGQKQARLFQLQLMLVRELAQGLALIRLQCPKGLEPERVQKQQERKRV
jgi:hypothetical protein